MRIIKIQVFLILVIFIAVYLITSPSKQQEEKPQKHSTTPIPEIDQPTKSTSKDHIQSASNDKYLVTIEQEIISQLDLESDLQICKVLIGGYVYDPASIPLKDARVSLEMDDAQEFEGTIVYTNEHGYFEINGELLAGKYILTVQHPEFKNAQKSVEIINNCEDLKYIMLEAYK